MKKTFSAKFIATAALILLVVFGSATFAWALDKAKVSDNTFAAAAFGLRCYSTEGEDLPLITDESEDDQLCPYESITKYFTLQNTGDVDGYVRLYASITDAGDLGNEVMVEISQAQEVDSILGGDQSVEYRPTGDPLYTGKLGELTQTGPLVLSAALSPEDGVLTYAVKFYLSENVEETFGNEDPLEFTFTAEMVQTAHNDGENPDFSKFFTASSTIYDNVLGIKVGCVIEGTLITLADGTQKPVEELTLEDSLRTFNFKTGEADSNLPLYILKHDARPVYLMHVALDNGGSLDICDWQSLFDMDAREYFDVNPSTYLDAIGKNIMYLEGPDATNPISVQIMDVTLEIKECACYEIYTEYNKNFVANSILTIEPQTWYPGTYVINENLAIDQEQYQRDVEQYGLYSYKDFWSNYISQSSFEKAGIADCKIAVGKGIISEKWLMSSFLEYLPQHKKGMGIE